jgi:hypothetical protein
MVSSAPDPFRKSLFAVPDMRALPDGTKPINAIGQGHRKEPNQQNPHANICE